MLWLDGLGASCMCVIGDYCYMPLHALSVCLSLCEWLCSTLVLAGRAATRGALLTAVGGDFID